jgi:hypothetical protein
VTSDDYAVYTDFSPSTPMLYAQALTAGSKAITLGTVDSNDFVFVAGKAVVFGTSSGNDQNGPAGGAAMVWTSAATAAASLGSNVILATQFAAPMAISSDGSYVVFFDDLDSTSTTATIYVAGSDGTGKKALESSVDVSYDQCAAQVGYAGSYALTAYCLVGDGGVDAGEADGGTNFNVATVASFTGASWTEATLATNVQSALAADQGGTHVVVNGATGTVAVPIGGGSAGVTIDPAGELGSFTFSPGVLSSDGSHLAYTTTGQALDYASTSTPPSPLQLSPAGTFSDAITLSPDGNWVIGINQVDQSSGLTDLYLASTTAADGGAIGLETTTASYPLEGQLFTTDSSHVVYFTGLSQSGGTLNARALTAGATATVLGSSAVTDLATAGAKIVFNGNAIGTNNGNYADLSGVDTSQTAAPALLVSAADPQFLLNNEKTVIVYTWSYLAGSSAGLWTLPAP